MFKGKIIILATTVIAKAPITEGQLVGSDGTPTGVDGVVLGVAAHDAASGEAVTVDILGIADMNATSGITRDAALSSNASAKPVAGGAKPFGRALNDANPGGRVSVLLLPR